MNLVIDTNIFISSLIKDGLTRYMIVNSPFKLFIPEQEIVEIRKYENIILEKSGITRNELVKIFKELLGYVRVIKNKELLPFRREANRIMNAIDEKDVPFIAAALSLNCSVWSEDKHFRKQKRVKIFTTKEIMEIYKIG